MSVERIVKDSIREADALEKALEDERRALESRDAAALGAAAEEKRRRVARLEALDAARMAARPQVPAAAERPPAAADPTATASADQWQRFLAIVARCNALNTTNGAIIRLRRQQVDDALRIVSGTGPGTYGPSGSQSTSRPRQALAAV
jgi:flagellar biosynthesis/type III secretory pathway chaperone